MAEAVLRRPAVDRERLFRLLQNYGVYAAIVLLVVVNAGITRNFLTLANLRVQLFQAVPILVVALGMALVSYQVRDGLIAEPRVALGGVEALPRRIEEAERAMLGHPAGRATFVRAADAAAAVVDPLEDAVTSADYRRDLGAFFGSVHGTLNHLLLGDTIWMTRFEGGGHPSTNLDAILFEQSDRFNPLAMQHPPGQLIE